MSKHELYDDSFELPFDEDGRIDEYQIIGTRSRGIEEWKQRKEAEEFERLIDRLRQQKYWRNLPLEKKRQIIEKRKQWARQNPERVRESARKAKKKRRANGKEAAERRRRRAELRQERRAATVYTCGNCGAQWSPVGRIPSRPPKWCSTRCASAAQYEREKAREADCTPDRVGYGERVQAVLALEGDLTTSRLMQEMALTRRYAQRVLYEMHSRGHIIRVARGRYRKPTDSEST